MRPNIGNDVDNKLRHYKQSFLEKTLDTGKGLGATNEEMNPRSPVSKSAIPAGKIEKYSIQNLPKIGTVDGHEIKDKVTETIGSIRNNQNNPDNGILPTKEKTYEAIDKLQTDGLIENIAPDKKQSHKNMQKRYYNQAQTWRLFTTTNTDIDC